MLRDIIVILIVLSSCCLSFEVREETTYMNMDSTGQTAHRVVKLDNAICMFTYSATGSKIKYENWKMSVKEVSENKYECHIESTQGFSFLKFKVFIVSFEPFLLQEVEIFDNYGAILEDEEYFVINNSVKPMDGFRSNIAAIHMAATNITYSPIPNVKGV